MVCEAVGVPSTRTVVGAPVTATNSVAVHDRTAKARIVIAAPARAVSSHVRPPSVSTR